jgi:Predicted endonuclease containing a URI domain
MNYYVYIIYSQSRERYYIGYSHNPLERLEEHNLGATSSTRSGRPWVLVYKEEYLSKHDAIVREREMKRMKSRKFIESLLKK